MGAKCAAVVAIVVGTGCASRAAPAPAKVVAERESRPARPLIEGSLGSRMQSTALKGPEACKTPVRRRLGPLASLPTVGPGAPIAVELHDTLGNAGSAFDLRGYSVALDDEEVAANVPAEVGAPVVRAEPLYVGRLAEGDHVLESRLLYQLRPMGYGVFSMSFRTYCVLIDHRYPFKVRAGKATFELHVSSYENGGVTTPLEDRPAVRVDVHVLGEVQATDAE